MTDRRKELLKKLTANEKKEISDRIEDWEYVMSQVRSEKYLDRYRFTQTDINEVRNASNETRPPFVIFIEEWARLGKVRRPYVIDLYRICVEAVEEEAANYILEEILNGNGEIDQNDMWGMGVNHQEDNQLSEALENSMDGKYCQNTCDSQSECQCIDNVLEVNESYLDHITGRWSHKIGKGAAAKVFKAETSLNRKKLAVKKLEIGGDSLIKNEAEAKNEIETEKQILPLLRRYHQGIPLQHSNIADLLAFCEKPPCLIYPLIDGHTLEYALHSENLNVEQKLKIAKDVAEAIKHIHTTEKKRDGEDIVLVHKDIKPENIMLEEVKNDSNENSSKLYKAILIDFGIADEFQVISGNTSQLTTQGGRGTLAYIDLRPGSQDGTVNRARDVYAFGVVLMELVLGYGKDNEEDPRNFNYRHSEKFNGPNLCDIKEFWSNDEERFDKVVKEKLLKISIDCLKEKDKGQKKMVEVCESLCLINLN